MTTLTLEKYVELTVNPDYRGITDYIALNEFDPQNTYRLINMLFERITQEEFLLESQQLYEHLNKHSDINIPEGTGPSWQLYQINGQVISISLTYAECKDDRVLGISYSTGGGLCESHVHIFNNGEIETEFSNQYERAMFNLSLMHTLALIDNPVQYAHNLFSQIL
jgi:hypothetical protein